MDILEFLLIIVVLFLLIYFAVRLAIKPLIKNINLNLNCEDEIGLGELKDMGYLNFEDYEEKIRRLKAYYELQGAEKK